MAITKSSKQRFAIMDVLRNTKCHPTAEWVYEEVRKKIPNISLGTVYRNLSKLSDDKSIVKLNIGTSSEHFDGNTIPHYHVSCVECGKIFDIEELPEFNMNKWASEKFNGEIIEHRTVFTGICSECKNI